VSGRRVVLTAALLLAALALTAGSLSKASTLRATWPAEADTFYLPSSRVMRVASLGHHELSSDLVAARANVYFGTQILAKGEQRYLIDYVERAIDLDPYFHRLYLGGAAMVTYNGKKPDLPTLLAATAVLERGNTTFPLDWELLFQLGFNYLFELPKLTDANDQRAPHWRQRGVEALRQAALFEGVPEWLPNLVAKMLTKGGSDAMAIRHLEQAYAVAASDEARLQIRAELQLLRGAQISRQLEEEHRRYQALIEARYPYAPDAFSMVAGERRPRAVDLPALAAPAARDERQP
jgi:hypothetical protein